MFFQKPIKKNTQVLKLHQTIHYPNYIRKNGCIANFNGGPSEESMKTHVTNPGRKTQRRNLTLAHQTSLRYIENLIIDIGHNIALNSRQYDTKLFCDHNNSDYFNDIGNDHFYVNTLKNTSKNISSKCTRRSQNFEEQIFITGKQLISVEYIYDECVLSNREIGYEIIDVEYSKSSYPINKSLKKKIISKNDRIYNSEFMKVVFEKFNRMNFFKEDDIDENHIVTFGTFKKGGCIFRSTPEFYGKDDDNEWYDWVNIDWDESTTLDDDEDEIRKSYPAQLLMFIDIHETLKINGQKWEHVKGCPHSQYIAIVKSAKESTLPDSERNDTKLATYFDLHDELYIIGIDNILSGAYVIYDRDYSAQTDPLLEHGKLSRIISITDRTK